MLPFFFTIISSVDFPYPHCRAINPFLNRNTLAITLYVPVSFIIPVIPINLKLNRFVTVPLLPHP